MPVARPHGRFLAGEAGELAGVSGTTIGQWARRGLIRASQSAGDPHVYGVEDVAEAAIVRALLRGGLSHAAIRRAIAALGEYGAWPLSRAPLGVTDEDDAARLVLRADDGVYALSGRGWQRLAVEPRLRELGPPPALAVLVAAGDGTPPSEVGREASNRSASDPMRRRRP
jgi:DNA-binding transcriptional MerR regulator